MADGSEKALIIVLKVVNQHPRLKFIQPHLITCALVAITVPTLV